MLERLGFSVITAGDGVEAVDLFRKHAASIRLVLLDMSMPKLSGPEVFEALCEIRDDIPVILCSGYGEKTATVDIRGGSLAGFMHKPYEMQSLREILHRILVTS